jgi:hypothetical protein
VICALPFPGHIGIDWKLAEKQSAFRNQGLISHSEETKKGKIFVILSQLKKLSKSNDVNAQKCFFNNTSRTTIAAENSRYRRW